MSAHGAWKSGYAKGTRLILGEDASPPITVADRYEVHRPVELALAVGDRPIHDISLREAVSLGSSVGGG
jgi:hypothetical protein